MNTNPISIMFTRMLNEQTFAAGWMQGKSIYKLDGPVDSLTVSCEAFWRSEGSKGSIRGEGLLVGMEIRRRRDT